MMRKMTCHQTLNLVMMKVMEEIRREKVMVTKEMMEIVAMRTTSGKITQKK